MPSDQPTPDPMPVFVLKGKDALAPGIIDAYRRECDRHDLGEQAQQVLLAFEEMAAWQRRNWTLVKLPDHEHVPAATSTQADVDAAYERGKAEQAAEVEPVVEHAIEMSSGAMQVRNDHPEIERIFPLADWIESNQRFGGKVWRRRVVVVDDWAEVPNAKTGAPDA